MDVSRASLVLAAAVLLLSCPLAWTRDLGCAEPYEIEADQGWSTAVGCRAVTDRRADVRGPVRLLFDRPLDLNRADAAALQVLPHIGPSRAAAIIAARLHRPFRSVDELERVHGIGPKTVAGLSSWVEVGGAP